MTKRILSMLLVLTMVLSIAVMGVSADAAWGGMTDRDDNIAGSGTANDPFIIDTPQKLAWLSYAVENYTEATAFLQKKNPAAAAQVSNKVFADYVFKQTADIDLNNQKFMPIGTYHGDYAARHLFGGDYDGNGYKIMNAKVSVADHKGQSYAPRLADLAYPTADLRDGIAAGLYDALFNYSSGGVIKNVHAVNVDTGNYDAQHTSSTAAAIIVGGAINGAIIGCTTDATSSATATYASGIAVANYKNKPGEGGTLIEDCVNGATITSASGRAAGIFAHPTSAGDVVRNCTNNGTVSGKTHIGGVVAFAYGGQVIDCVNNGAVTSSTNLVGGIVGRSYCSVVSGCVNNGTITGMNETGGIVGFQNAATPIIDCVNNGNVVSTGKHAGGILGSCEGFAVTVTNCVNNGFVDGANYAGGIVGWLKLGGDISWCVNNGTVNASAYVGGILGWAQDGSNVYYTISYCVNTGTMTMDANTRVVTAGGILSGSNGETGKAPLNMAFSYCYNLADTFYINYIVDMPAGKNYVPCGGGIMGHGFPQSGTNSERSFDNCYSVAGVINFTGHNDGLVVEDYAWESNQYPSTTPVAYAYAGLFSGTTSAGQFIGGEGLASNNEIAGYLATCGYGLSVAEIEAMSVYKEIIAATPADDADIKFIGVQDSLIKGETYDVRFVAGIDSLEFEAAGFMVKITSEKNGAMAEAAKIADTTVYTSLVGKKDDETIVYNAADYDTTYFVALSIEGINLATYGAITFEITPFTTVDGVDVEGHTYVVSYDGDGNFVSCARQ